MLHVFRKALPFVLSPEKSDGVAGWSLEESEEWEEGGGGVGGLGTGVGGEMGVWE